MYLFATSPAATRLQQGGESVEYQGRKKAKTSNIIPVIDGNGNIVGTSEIIGGRHNDSYELKGTISKVFADLNRNHLEYRGAFFNADSGLDTREARKMLWNRGVRPNSPENKRSRNHVKRERKRCFI